MARRCGTVGFTLIELSIVLVIIGFLVGGVLVGADLIRQAEIHSVISDLGKFQTAIYTFQTKYDALPGDMSTATDFWGISEGGCPDGSGAGTCNGNGNGLMDSGWQGVLEGFRAWQQLAYAGLIPGAYTGVRGPARPSIESDPGINVPASRISGVGYTIEDDSDYVAPGAVPYLFSATYHNVIAVGKSPSHWDTIEPAFTAAEMYKIDLKLDDGLPGTGHIVTRPNIDASGGGQPNCTNGDNTQGTTATYAQHTTGPACGFYYLNFW